MSEDTLSTEKIDELVRSGEQNLQTSRLIKAWCTHARIERGGGRGIVEELYNVPIGSIGIQCSHAPKGGLMSWDLKDSFFPFYESNCKTC